MRSSSRAICAALMAVGLTASACGEQEGDRDDDFGSPTAPSAVETTPTPTPTPTPTVTIAYEPDIKPIFDADCVRRHGGSRPSAGYNMSTYAGVMTRVAPGSASSALVVATRSGGFMNSYFSGDRAAKAELVRRWVVENGAAERR